MVISNFVLDGLDFISIYECYVISVTWRQDLSICRLDLYNLAIIWTTFEKHRLHAEGKRSEITLITKRSEFS